MSAVAQISDRKQAIPFRQILVATDFSAASQRAFDYAAAIARRHGSRISVVHAIPPDPREPIPIYPLPRELDRKRLDAEKQLHQIGDKIQDLNPQLLLEKGPAWEIVTAEIEREHIDLLVLGTRGRGGIKKLALGSVAEKILHLVHCPVLTVGPNVPLAGKDKFEFKRILFATDFGPTTENGSNYALSLAEDYQAELLFLHMVPPIPIPNLGPSAYCPGPYIADALFNWQKSVREESAKKLRTLLPPHANLPQEPEYVVGMDFLPEGILDVAAMHDIQLIVMGANHERSAQAAAHIPWALTHDVICHAKCPVLTISSLGIA